MSSTSQTVLLLERKHSFGHGPLKENDDGDVTTNRLPLTAFEGYGVTTEQRQRGAWWHTDSLLEEEVGLLPGEATGQGAMPPSGSVKSRALCGRR